MSRYAFSDLHGQYELWKQIVNYIDDSDEVYCLGDCIDRHRDGAKILLEMSTDERFTLLAGNHEQMMVEYFSGINNLWFYNGGHDTFDELEENDFRDLEYLLDYLSEPITEVTLETQKGTIILNHCGFTPEKDYELYWDRNHFIDRWPHVDYPNTYIVHGHTPVQYVEFYYDHWGNSDLITVNRYIDIEAITEVVEPKVFTYCEGHKIDIDMGSAFSYRAALLDLDTLEPIYFDI